MKNRKRTIISVCGLLAIGIIIVSCYMYLCTYKLLSRHYLDDLELNAPNGDYKLQICEWEALGGGGAEIYYVNNDERVLLGETAVKSGVYSFADGDYVIEWTDEYICIKYRSGRGVETEDPSSWRENTFFLP